MQTAIDASALLMAEDAKVADDTQTRRQRTQLFRYQFSEYRGGDLTVNGGATMTGSDVTLVFVSQNCNEFGTVQINGNATISLTASKTGATAGIVVFGDRRITHRHGFQVQWMGNLILWRLIYVPSGREFLRRRKYRHKQNTTDRKYGEIYRHFRIRAELNNYGTKPFSPLVVKLTS